VEAALLADNSHTCCICHTDYRHVQIHHIDGNPGNNNPQNLAVVCLNCHSRVTGKEGLGKSISHLEVAEFKRRWEKECEAALKATAERRLIERAVEARTLLEVSGPDALFPLYVNSDLVKRVAARVGFNVGENVRLGEVDGLVAALKRAKLLSKRRPDKLKEHDNRKLVFERVTATKLVFPSTLLQTKLPQLRELAVWVAEPDEQVLSARGDDVWDFSGTFLYLVTPLYDYKQSETFMSGCSSLQVISNLVTGKPFMARDWSEPLGRKSFLHPIDKLRSMGAILIDHREIETLYMCRYFSDEQRFMTDKAAYRVHDLLAYPLVIHNDPDFLKSQLGKLSAK